MGERDAPRLRRDSAALPSSPTAPNSSSSSRSMRLLPLRSPVGAADVVLAVFCTPAAPLPSEVVPAPRVSPSRRELASRSWASISRRTSMSTSSPSSSSIRAARSAASASAAASRAAQSSSSSSAGGGGAEAKAERLEPGGEGRRKGGGRLSSARAVMAAVARRGARVSSESRARSFAPTTRPPPRAASRERLPARTESCCRDRRAHHAIVRLSAAWHTRRSGRGETMAAHRLLAPARPRSRSHSTLEPSCSTD